MSITKQRKAYRSVLLVPALVMAVGLLGGCAKQKIQNVENESEANRIVDILGESGIRATKKEAGEGERRYFEIEVDGGDEITAAAIQVMVDHCLAQSPPEKPEGSGVVTSSQVEKEREARRRKLSIESQLRDIPGTTCVQVNFVMPEDSSIAIDRYSSTASALVTYKTATFPLSKERVAEMVAKGVPALKAENVQVELLQKPVRPLPDYATGYNFARVGIISLLGFLTVLLTISIVFVLQKRRDTIPVNDLGPIDQDRSREAPLLEAEDLDDRGRVA
jgi:type III secretory pathway lipoprotein EscJ